jgi:hypothetical protein
MGYMDKLHFIAHILLLYIRYDAIRFLQYSCQYRSKYSSKILLLAFSQHFFSFSYYHDKILHIRVDRIKPRVLLQIYDSFLWIKNESRSEEIRNAMCRIKNCKRFFTRYGYKPKKKERNG